ncbi:MAG TPA: IS481 family transposase, partial [Solirubrobacterales bacterium]|nr:IS481 family transposase [Solirubrobacterales bacterium]
DEGRSPVAKARYLVEAHLVEGRSVAELAKAHGVHRSWIYKLLARYREGGYEALEPRSRAPRSSPNRTPEEVVRAVVSLREQLLSHGHDCGAETIAHHLARQGIDGVPSVSTIWRILRREGLVSPQPQKRPRSSLIRFEADLPNEMWQADITHWRLAGGQDVEILNMIDDHSRLFLASRAFSTTKAADVVAVFRSAIELHGTPASLLCDNGAVFTASPRGGKVLLQSEMERLGVVAKNSRPYHPQTCGKVERLHQTLKRYLARQAAAKTLSGLQSQLDAFCHYYNAIRPHRALGGRTPLQAYSARLKARPASKEAPETHFRIRHDKVDEAGTVTLRHDSRLHHIGLGRAHKGKPIKLLVADRDVRVLDARTGELIRRLTLDPSRDYQPIGGG